MGPLTSISGTNFSLYLRGLYGSARVSVYCGKPDFILALCSGVRDYYPPQAHRPRRREMSTRGYALSQRMPPTLPLPFKIKAKRLEKTSSLLLEDVSIGVWAAVCGAGRCLGLVAGDGGWTTWRSGVASPM